jgi:hypothetical protein
MAVAFGTVTTTAGTGYSSSIIINVPAGTVDGDLLLLSAGNDNPSDYTTPTGWTRLQTPTYAATGINVLWWRTASSEPASYTLNPVSSAINTAVMVRYTGASGIRSSANTVSTQQQTVSPTPVVPADITGTDMVVHFYGWHAVAGSAGATLTAPSSPWSVRANFGTTVAADWNNSQAVVDQIGATSATTTSASLSNGVWTITSVALTQAVAPDPLRLPIHPIYVP